MRMAASRCYPKSRGTSKERRHAMQNAHQRIGKLTFVRQSRDTITNVSVFLERLVAEPADEHSGTSLHLLSVFGGDQEIGAVVAAANQGLRFQVAFDGRQLIGNLGEK